MNFRSFLNEKFKNFFHNDIAEKERYSEEVYQLLQTSYASIGGIKGSGFNSPADMVKNIPFWKLAFSKGVLVAAVMYKDKNGRKLVAIGSDGSTDARKQVKSILTIEFERSYSEISGPLLAYMEKRLPDILQKYKIKSNLVKDIIKKEIEPIDDYYYTRKIGSSKIRKIALGTINKPII